MLWPSTLTRRRCLPVYFCWIMLTVVTRAVSHAIEKCELTCIDREPINVDRVRQQHAAYVHQFRTASDLTVKVINSTVRDERDVDSNDTEQTSSAVCSPASDTGAPHHLVRVVDLPELPDYADSMFVEDVAVVFDEFALLTRPGAESRRGEVEFIRPTLAALRPDHLHEIQEPGKMDGGDILVVGRHIFVGQSSRTNEPAFSQLYSIAEKYGYTCYAVRVKGCLHLKSAASMLDKSTVLLREELIDTEIFTSKGLGVVRVAPPGSPNVLSYALGNPQQRFIVVPAEDSVCDVAVRSWASEAGSHIHILRTPGDEIAKAEGALTCCSLLCYPHKV
jgi:dimethylargininase